MTGDDKKVKRQGGTTGVVNYYVHKCSEHINKNSRKKQISLREEKGFKIIDAEIKKQQAQSLIVWQMPYNILMKSVLLNYKELTNTKVRKLTQLLPRDDTFRTYLDEVFWGISLWMSN